MVAAPNQNFSVEAMGIEPTNLLHAMQIFDCPGRILPWFLFAGVEPCSVEKPL
jgi:hypothetical protein